MKIRINNPIYGVPITYLGNHCPDQFKIIGTTENANYLKDLHIDGYTEHGGYINGKKKYTRLLIKRK